MRQLQLFTTAELAKMRDRTASRNYSPDRDEFRRVNERQRAWGKAQGHGERLRRQRASLRDPRTATTTPTHPETPTPKPSLSRTSAPTSPPQAGSHTTPAADPSRVQAALRHIVTRPTPRGTSPTDRPPMPDHAQHNDQPRPAERCAATTTANTKPATTVEDREPQHRAEPAAHQPTPAGADTAAPSTDLHTTALPRDGHTATQHHQRPNSPTRPLPDRPRQINPRPAEQSRPRPGNSARTYARSAGKIGHQNRYCARPPRPPASSGPSSGRRVDVGAHLRAVGRPPDGEWMSVPTCEQWAVLPTPNGNSPTSRHPLPRHAKQNDQQTCRVAPGPSGPAGADGSGSARQSRPDPPKSGPVRATQPGHARNAEPVLPTRSRRFLGHVGKVERDHTAPSRRPTSARKPHVEGIATVSGSPTGVRQDPCALRRQIDHRGSGRADIDFILCATVALRCCSASIRVAAADAVPEAAGLGIDVSKSSRGAACWQQLGGQARRRPRRA
jgi:hypothetical protein